MDQTTDVMQAPVDATGQLNGSQPPQPQGQTPLVNLGEGERYGSILGGAGLILAGLTRRGAGGVILGVLGTALIVRGVSGHCGLYGRFGISGAKSERPGVPDNVGITVERSIVINRPREEVFAFWRDVANLGDVMKHVERIESADGLRSHWVVRTPWGRRLEWDAAVINEHPNELIAWESLPGAKVQNAGAVRDMRQKSNELSKAILAFMNKNKIDEFQLADGKLCRKLSKRTQSLQKDHIIDTLKSALGSQERVEKIFGDMNANRQTVESESLRRTRQGKTTAET